jgi:hypothetical protein
MNLHSHGDDGGDEYIGDGMHGLGGRWSWSAVVCSMVGMMVKAHVACR